MSSKPQIIITGASGLIGSRTLSLLAADYTLTPLRSADDGRVDITDQRALESALEQYPQATAMIHLAAFTDVNAAWQQQGDKLAPAWQTNVVGSQHIAKACQKRGWYLLYTSTAFVFSGDKEGLYTEADSPAPIEWYGQTKAASEEIILNAGGKNVILRIDQPFTHLPFKKADTLHRVINGLQQGTLYPQFSNHFFGPTYIDDLVKIFSWCLKHQPQGIYHASSGEQWSDFAFAQMVADTLEINASVTKGDLQAYLQTIQRPYQKNTAMDNSKLKAALDFPLLTIKQAVAKAKNYVH